MLRLFDVVCPPEKQGLRCSKHGQSLSAQPISPRDDLRILKAHGNDFPGGFVLVKLRFSSKWDDSDLLVSVNESHGPGAVLHHGHPCLRGTVENTGSEKTMRIPPTEDGHDRWGDIGLAAYGFYSPACPEDRRGIDEKRYPVAGG